MRRAVVARGFLLESSKRRSVANAFDEVRDLSEVTSLAVSRCNGSGETLPESRSGAASAVLYLSGEALPAGYPGRRVTTRNVYGSGGGMHRGFRPSWLRRPAPKTSRRNHRPSLQRDRGRRRQKQGSRWHPAVHDPNSDPALESASPR